jgi:Na+/proline symporter
MAVAMILYGIAILFMMICIGTAVGAVSKATSDKPKAKTMGITAFAFCLLGVLFAAGGAGASKFGVHNAPPS